VSDADEAQDPGSYRFWIDDRVRFSDLDALGHCNNNAIGGFFESSRVALLAAAGIGLDHGSLLPVLARSLVNFRREIFYGADVRVGCRALRFGRTSLTLGNAVFDAGRCAADGEVVLVFLERAGRRPAEIPADLRARLSALA
jgi:acyl-CoA thioester hydrolase